MSARFDALAPAGFATIASLADRIWRQHYASIVSVAQIEYMLARRYTDENLAAYVDSATRWMFVVRAADDGEAVGYFSYKRISDEEMKLEQLYLLAERRGAGLGSRMIAHVEDHARALGCARLSLTVNKQNRGAIQVYERRGFAVREEAVFDIGGGYVMDDYVMEKPL